MRSFIFFVFLSILFQSCIVNHQVFEVTSSDSKDVNNTLVFENDTLRITYDFWNDAGGAVGFQIHNKTKKPIYINWSKSNLIHNGISQDYYQDTETSSSTARAASYRGVGVANGVSVATKEKPAVQIPPNSAIYVKKFNLNHGWIPGERNKKENYTTWEFNRDNTTLLFRNYLAVSFDSDYHSEFFIDNTFWVSKVHMVKDRAYWNNEFPYSHKKQFHLSQNNSSKVTGFTLLGLIVITFVTIGITAGN